MTKFRSPVVLENREERWFQKSAIGLFFTSYTDWVEVIVETVSYDNILNMKCKSPGNKYVGPYEQKSFDIFLNLGEIVVRKVTGKDNREN